MKHYSEEEKKLTRELNDSGVIPLRTKVLVKFEKFKEKTEGGIILTPAATKNNWRARIIALGAYARTQEHEDEAEYLKVGDLVELQEYSGIDAVDPSKRFGKTETGTYRYIEYREIIGKVIENASN